MNIVFSFDDGRLDAYEAYQILKKLNLTASFHITTGFVDGEFQTECFGINRKSITKEAIIEMHNNKMDISSHGNKHVIDTSDFISSINKFKQWGITKNKYGFSVPNSNYTDDLLKEFIKENNNYIQYVRVGRSDKCYTLLSKIHYVLYKIFKNQYSYNQFNKHNIIDNINKYKINSLVIKDYVKVKNLIRFIDRYKNSDSTLVIMFHSIVDNPINQWEWSKSNFTKLCDYLSKGKSTIEVLTLEELTKDL